MAEKSAARKSETETRINFSVLKKLDPGIEKIIDTASSVAHYEFNSNSGVWEKTEVEGSLFLYSRNVAPFVVIFIMNRLSKENTKLILTAEMEIRIQQPFLLCKLRNNEIIGIWFFDAKECERFGKLLIKLSMLCKDETKLKIALMMETQKKLDKQRLEKEKKAAEAKGIVGLFNKAQEEFMTKNQARNPSPQTKQQQQMQQQNKKPQQNPNKNMNKKAIETNQSKPPVDKKRQQQPRRSPSAVRRQERQDEMKRQQEALNDMHRNEQDLLMSILHGTNKDNTNSRLRTVSTSEPIAKNTDFDINRFSSQAGDLAVSGDILGAKAHKVIGCAELESELIRNRNRISNDLQVQEKEVYMREVRSYPNLRNIEGHAEKPPDSLDLNTTPKSDGKRARIAVTGALSVPSKGPVSLLSPSVVAAGSQSGGGGKGRGATMLNNQKISLAANFGSSSPSGGKVAKKLFPDDVNEQEESLPKAPSISMLNSLMSPAAFLQPSKQFTSSNEQPTTETCPLTKEQFQQAFVRVLQTDDNFVTSLHQAYMDHVNKS